MSSDRQGIQEILTVDELQLNSNQLESSMDTNHNYFMLVAVKNGKLLSLQDDTEFTLKQSHVANINLGKSGQVRGGFKIYRSAAAALTSVPDKKSKYPTYPRALMRARASGP